MDFNKYKHYIAPTIIQNIASTIIQKYYRGYKIRIELELKNPESKKHLIYCALGLLNKRYYNYREKINEFEYIIQQLKFNNNNLNNIIITIKKIDNIINILSNSNNKITEYAIYKYINI